MWALKRDFPELEFSLNGVVQDCHEAAAALQHEEAGAQLHGVMIGRAAYHGPWACLGNADMAVFGAASNAAANRREVRSTLRLACLSKNVLCMHEDLWRPGTLCCALPACQAGVIAIEIAGEYYHILLPMYTDAWGLPRGRWQRSS